MLEKAGGADRDRTDDLLSAIQAFVSRHLPTWEETKRLQLKRIENNPRNAAAWFALAAGSEQFEDYRTTKAYYEKAMSVSRELGGPHVDETVRGVERILDLLPAYYGDREHLVIVRENLGGPGTPTVVELRERKALPPRANEKQR